MKKFTGIFFILVFSCASIFFMTACGDDAPKPKEFTITYSAGSGGSITGDTAQTVTEGGNGTPVTATAQEGYLFTEWSDGNKNETRQELGVTEDMRFEAQFKKQTVAANYSAETGGRISGNPSQSIGYGDDAETVTAVPDAGYVFTEWSDGETEALRQDKAVTAPIAVTAHFRFLFNGGKGTKAEPFLLRDYEQFKNMTFYPEAHYKLTGDLDLQGIKHMPLFDENVPFGGGFDGDGYTIRNMTVDAYTSLPSLFGYIDADGSVKDLKMTGVSITVPNFDTTENLLCVGSVAGVSFGILERISVEGTIGGSDLYYDGVAIGGLVGQAFNELRNCTANMNLAITDSNTQGVMTESYNIGEFFDVRIGGLVGGGHSNVTSCITTGSIKIFNSNRSVLAGGLIGYLGETIAPLEKIEIQDCFTDIEIFSGSNTTGAGLIAEIRTTNYLTIADCGTDGDISGCAYSAGLFYSNASVRAGVSIANSYTKGNIGNTSHAAGFAYKLYNGTVTNCFAAGNISASFASGFCYEVGDSNFYRCYSTGDVVANVCAVGFASSLRYSSPATLQSGLIEECFTTGNITAAVRAAGFIFNFIGNIKNCYSTSDITFTNTDPNRRTLLGGFIGVINGSKISNSYYAGKIIVDGIITESSSIGIPSIAGAFIGTVGESTIIENCHFLNHEDNGLKKVIGESKVLDTAVDVTTYKGIVEMDGLTELLNADSETPIWANGENGLPILNFVKII